MQFSKTIPFQGAEVPVDVVSDKYIFDSEIMLNTPVVHSEQPFFVSKTGKSLAQANFEGDNSLVSEGRIFEVLGIYVFFYQATTKKSVADAALCFDAGYYEWNTQGTLTDRDWLHQIMGSTDLYDTAGVDTPSQGNGSHANIRKYQVSRFVPGGRSIEFRLSWPDGGLTLTEDAIIYVRLYGYELIPRDI